MTRRDDRLSWWQEWREHRRLRHDLHLELHRAQGQADMWHTRAHTLERQRNTARAETDAAVKAADRHGRQLAAIQMLLGDGDLSPERRLDRIAQVFMDANPVEVDRG